MTTQTITELKAYCQENNIEVTGDKRKKQSYLDAIASKEARHSNEIIAVIHDFSGFYESYLAPEEVYYCALNDDDNIEEISDNCWDNFDSVAYQDTVGKYYIDSLNYWLEAINISDNKFTPVEFTEINSPRFYNYSTDRLFCKLSDSLLKSLIQLCHSSANLEFFTNYIKDKFEDKSNFVSYYSRDVNDWLELTSSSLDFNQVGTYVAAGLHLLHPTMSNIWERIGMETVEELNGNTCFSDFIKCVQTRELSRV